MAFRCLLSFLGLLHSFQSGNLEQLAMNGQGGGISGSDLQCFWETCRDNRRYDFVCRTFFLSGFSWHLIFIASVFGFAQRVDKAARFGSIVFCRKGCGVKGEKLLMLTSQHHRQVPESGMDVLVVDPVVTEQEKLEQENIKHIHFPAR